MLTLYEAASEILAKYGLDPQKYSWMRPVWMLLSPKTLIPIYFPYQSFECW